MFDFFTHRHQAAKQEIFFVPKPDPFENPLVETDPGELRTWATALPFANPEQLAEAMLASLSRLNRYPGQVKKLDELIGIYHTPALRIAHGSSYRKNLLPKPLLRRVMQEMAYAYSKIANECLCTKASRRNLDRLTKAIYYSIKYYLLEYLYACESFDCRTGHTYREMTRLCTYAEEQGIHETEIEDSDNSLEPEQATISHQYNRFLLLRLLDPCHLQQGEPRICYDYLNSIASHARLKAPTPDTEQSGHYVIDRLGDVPPHLYEPDGLDNLSQPRFILLDLNPVSLQIHQLLRGMERSEEHKPTCMSNLTNSETTNLLARMLKSWHIRPKRDSERHSTSGHVELWIGLHNIHYHLTGSDRHMAQESEEITMSSSQSLTSTIQDPDKPQLLARRFNQSRSGVALHLPPSAGERELIGELVLINLHGAVDPNEWKIGIIKRALNREEGVLEIGVQFLVGNIQPVTLQQTKLHSDEENEEITVNPALYIDQGHSHRSSLIVPKRFFIIGQEYRVEEMIPAPDISPLQLLENTAMFERYRIKGC
ncbi:MAG: hypothetical protein KZQ93_09205 [Candidatus Thiodiazotropha sp. (ex Monitilora ramsayi)]|nr:hypothetical protein [Candidatus Thiodiazotropha sp. (ex Monitilora ramsayi)]